MKFKTLFGMTALTICLMTSFAGAQEDFFASDIGSEEIETKASRGTPFFFNAFADGAGKAKINSGHFKGDKFQMAIANFEAGMIFYYNPCYKEGLLASLAYTETLYDWKSNPWFSQEHFQTATLSLAGFTKRLDNWFWRTQLQFNLDGWEWDANYLYYNFLVWGRYELSRDWGFHIGFYAETGMRIDRVYPVFGFDWQISEKWKLNAVFPFDMALNYQLNEIWTIALAGRTFDQRHRVNKKQSHPGSLARYLNGGIELMLKYDRNTVSANVHVGSTLGGVFRVSSSENRDAHHYYLDPVGYVGGEVNMKF